MADDSYSQRNLLKPSWVTRIEESGNGRGRTKVAATFPRCKCGRYQEQCAVTKKLDRDAADLYIHHTDLMLYIWIEAALV